MDQHTIDIGSLIFTKNDLFMPDTYKILDDTHIELSQNLFKRLLTDLVGRKINSSNFTLTSYFPDARQI